MSGIGLVLNIAKDALAAQRYGMDVTAHNIANVNSTGYSRQRAVFEPKEPAPYGGVLLGRGVDTKEIIRISDQFVENRLMQQGSSMLSFKEMENYMQVLEGVFSEDSESSISVLLADSWNLWHDVANNPSGASERIALYEHSVSLSGQFNSLYADLTQLEIDLTNAVSAGTGKINEITAEIAQINGEIVGIEAGRIANDLRDQRNTLVSELSEFLDVKTFEQGNGSLTVITARGCVLVDQHDSYDLEFGGDDGNSVVWQGSGGTTTDITDYLTNGKLGGWLDIRDEVIAKYKLDLDALAKEFIWAVNQQHSQGVGLKLFSGDVTGTYKTDSSGLLSTLTYGQKIDYTKDFRMWIDNGSAPTATTVDMGISSATLTNWAGTATGAAQYKYAFTVTTAGTVGADTDVTVTDGAGLGVVKTGADVTAALNSAIADDQTITVKGGPGGDQTVLIKDSDGDATRSANDIARALSALNGVTAYASDNSATVDISNLLHGVVNAQENDVVSFTLSSGGSTAGVSFTVSSTNATTRSNFWRALETAITTINGTGSDLSIDAGKLASDDIVSITSASGENIGIEDFSVLDNATGSFGGDYVGTNKWDNSETVSFDLKFGTTTQSVSVTTDADVTNAEIADEIASDLGIVGPAGSVTFTDAAGTVTITRNGNNFDFVTTNGLSLEFFNINDAGSADAEITLTANAGTLVTSTGLPGTINVTHGGNETLKPDTQVDDTIGFATETLIETDNPGPPPPDKAGVKTGTITVLLEPGLTIESNKGAAAGSLFNVGAGNAATTGDSIITLGDDGGFTGFSVGDTISFDVDGNNVSYTVGAGDDTDVEFATGLQTELINDLAGFIPGTYSIIRHGASVSILKHDDTPIEITDFADTGGSDATLAVSTGTGVGTAAPANTLLDASDSAKTSATSTLYGSEGVISWEKFDDTGVATGTSGTISVDDADPFDVDGLSFDINAGALVAGNTFTINTDATGAPDKLVLTASGSARSILDKYTFSVTTGGTIGTNTPEIAWSNDTTSGTVTVTGPGSYTVDGMTLSFTSGTLFAGDVFTITTDADGTPTASLPSDWHWTLDSFKDQFNAQATGVTASVTSDNALKFSPNSGYNFGFCDHNFDDCGLLAALGINTFFKGSSAGSIGTNTQIANKDYIAQ